MLGHLKWFYYWSDLMTWRKLRKAVMDLLAQVLQMGLMIGWRLELFRIKRMIRIKKVEKSWDKWIGWNHSDSWLKITWNTQHSDLLKNVYLIILRERERKWEREHARAEEGQRERRRERIPSRVCTVSPGPDVGLSLTTMRLWPELKSRVRCLTDWATQAPQIFFF